MIQHNFWKRNGWIHVDRCCAWSKVCWDFILLWIAKFCTNLIFNFSIANCKRYRYCYNRCIHICIKQGSLYRLLFVGDVSDETYNKRVLDTCSLHCFFFLVFGNNNTKDSSYSKLTDGLSSTCYLVRIIYTDNLIFRICFQGYTR